MTTTYVFNDTRVFQAIVIRRALLTYAEHKIKVNPAYTPKAMMRIAFDITGETFPARDYVGAAKELETWIESRKTEVPNE